MKTVTMQRKDGVVRTFNEADVKANPDKFKSWKEVPAGTKGKIVESSDAPKADKTPAKAAAKESDDGADKGNGSKSSQSGQGGPRGRAAAAAAD